MNDSTTYARASSTLASDIPHWLIRHGDVTDAACALYVYMQVFSGGELTFEAHRSELAETCGWSLDKLDRNVKVLEAIDALHVVRQGGGLPNVWQLAFNEPGDWEDVTFIPIETARDSRLSYAARGLLEMALSVDGEATSESLAQGGSGGRHAVLSAMRELRELGYLHERSVRDEKGRLRKEVCWTAVPIVEPWSEDLQLDLAHRQPTGCVYVAVFGDRAKIGYSKDPGRRIPQLEHGVGAVAEWWTSWPGDLNDEAELHGRFAAQRRARGEWFNLDGELSEFVQSLRGES